LVHIELEEIYVTLRATRTRTVEAEDAWLMREAGLAPGEWRAHRRAVEAQTRTETVTVSVDEALAADSRLVILGDPGSGKTTLLRYLALLYARDLAEGTALVADRLGLAERGYVPILFPLRRLGAYLKARRPVDDGTEGCGLLLRHYHEMLRGDRVHLPAGFFDPYLESGRAVVLLDGLDEVADRDLRRRVSRLVERFTAAYPDCRYVVASRIVGYRDAARLAEGYATTTIRDFLMRDVASFLRNWHRAVAVGQMGPGPSAEAYADRQTRALLAAIEGNERIRALAINPLMLTVIALVHRDRVKLPDRRAELYDEAVNVLLGKWDEARGVQEIAILADRPFDAGDRRLMLQAVALWMQEHAQKEIEAEDLRRLLGARFHDILGDWREASRAVDRFLRVIQERTGLLGEHGVGVYRFSHLTFQEYLAALAVAGRDDYVAYTLDHVGDPWWREVILLEAGHLSTQSRERTTRLIQAIANRRREPEPYHNLVLAADCLRDVGEGRVEGRLLVVIRQQLRQVMESRSLLSRVFRGVRQRRVAAAKALAKVGNREYWNLPYGEPEWVEIPTGEFWMGSEDNYREQPVHRIDLPTFYIARVPITNAQYQLFVEATDYEPPKHWEEDRPPKDKESHPVVDVSWDDVVVYCAWLSEVTGRSVTLPSEAEWEKAARGSKDRRAYPWGDAFDATRCNSRNLGLGDTTPVGIFVDGASPYGVLDMAGNVWEWTRSLYEVYPYDVGDGREELDSRDPRVLRGGAFFDYPRNVRCAYRLRFDPDFRYRHLGVRVVVSPSPSGA
jgi:formylglycine-generating enzyme required for sulfatase activity/energy-coupling factor transporter ATP-binding protein EcfA2